jgi:IS1 family transposase
MSVEGVSISAIARLKRHSWDAVYRWLLTARKACGHFNQRHLRDYELKEPQADELNTFVGNSRNKVWVLAMIESTSRLWVNSGTGGRTYKNIRLLLGKAFHRGISNGRVLITTDGFSMYARVIKRMFGVACLYGQVVKTGKKNRVTRVDQKIVIGDKWQIQEALDSSEDSDALNTSFIERHNLTLRQGSSYLARKSGCHAREITNLDGHLDLLQCYYNFSRRHMSLKFGKELWTPAMVAGIAKRRLSFRKIFESFWASGFMATTLRMADYDRFDTRKAA